MKIETPVLQSLARINANEPKFVEWLQSKVNQYGVDGLRQRDDVTLRNIQGRGQELLEIVELLKTANEILRKA